MYKSLREKETNLLRSYVERKRVNTLKVCENLNSMHSVNSRKTIKASVSPVKNDDENHSQDIADLHSQMKKDGRE